MDRMNLTRKQIQSDKHKIGWKTFVMLFIFVILSTLVLIPFLAIFVASFKPSSDLMRFGLNMKLDFEVMSLQNYQSLFSESKYFNWFKNSILITILQTIMTLMISAIVAYGFEMYQFKGKNIIFLFVLLIMMVPIEIIMLPLYQLIIKIALIDNVWGIILPFVAGPLPILFFRQYLSGIPKDFLDAGRIDGCTEYGIFSRIMLPLMAPSFAAMGIFVGMSSWNNFLWPMLVLRSDQKFTLPIGLNTLITPYGNNYDVLIAGSVFCIIPILILFLCMQRYFIEGMTAGGVKG